MPAKHPATQPKQPATPKASRKKRAKFTFRLLQPFFQFAALVLVVLAFTRCSPLAPSTDKSAFMEGNGPAGVMLKSEAMEQSIAASLQDLSSGEAKLISESEFRKVTEDVKSADDALDEGATKSIFERREKPAGFKAKPKILFLTLSNEQAQALLKDGKVRINLNERLAGARGKAKSAFVRHLQAEQKKGKLDASAYLVMPDSVIKRGTHDELSLEVQVAFGAPSEEESYLQISRAESEEIDAALLDAALRDLRALAIVLE